MLFWLGLVAGLIIGWVIEWIIDWRFWRRDLHQSLDSERKWRESLAAAQQEIADLRRQLAEQSALVAVPVAPLEDPLDAVVYRDPLEQINGVGATDARRLNDAGIFTFQQLAATDPTRLQAIIQPESWQKVDLDAWIAEANAFAQSDTRLSPLSSQPTNSPNE
jgi:predicted flap endonuclease-1-like 5' DNA nuclease